MNINSYSDSIYYIVCPSNNDTGGPKDLHQLAMELKNLGKKVFIYYFPINQDIKVHKNYEVFDIPFVDKIEDSERNILIVPETNQAILISKQYKKIQKLLWWLSLDFFFITNFTQNHSKYSQSIIKFPFKVVCFFNNITKNYFGNLSFSKYLKIIYLNYPFNNLVNLQDFKMNLSQSMYQYKVLNSKKVKSNLLFDYIRDEYFHARKDISLKNKKNIICYNPSKSSSFMKRIINSNPEIKFVKLENYNMNEVIEILSSSKIYIDFGFHPGVDHLPREAAILKNCIITNKEGSALYPEAVPISEKFKFEEKNKNLKKITEKINQIFDNFEEELKEFDNYIKQLENEKVNFRKQVSNIFTKTNN
jgi:hypothetical protein